MYNTKNKIKNPNAMITYKQLKFLTVLIKKKYKETNMQKRLIIKAEVLTVEEASIAINTLLMNKAKID